MDLNSIMEINKLNVVITGGGSGLGFACAGLLAKHHANIAIIDANADKVSQAKKSLNCLGFVVDICDSSAIQKTVNSIEKELGQIDVCINCAGIASGKRIVGKQGPQLLEEFSQVININLCGTFNVMRIVADKMIRNNPSDKTHERGVIINTASIAAFEGQIGQSAYAASKAGVCGLTLPAAREFSQFGIRVMTIAPGLMDTPMMRGLSDKVQDSLKQTLLFPKCFGRSEEFAKLVLEIITNPMLNGSIIRLDGGLRLQ